MVSKCTTHDEVMIDRQRKKWSGDTKDSTDLSIEGRVIDSLDTVDYQRKFDTTHRRKQRKTSIQSEKAEKQGGSCCSTNEQCLIF